MRDFSSSELDEVNEEILNESLGARKRISNPLVGDYVKRSNGHLYRISVIHRSAGEFQTKMIGAGTFNITTDGLCDFTGSCEYDLFKISDLELLDEVAPGPVCFFNHGEVRHSNLICVTDVYFKVWAIKK